MRFSIFLLTGAAAALAAVGATAQDGPTKAEAPPAKAEPQRLPDIEETVEELLREETDPSSLETPPAEPVETPAAEPVEAPAAEPEPAPPPPAAQSPAPAPSPAAAEPAGPPPPLTRAQIAALDRTVARGRLLIAIARAGIVATQDMLTRVSDPNGAGISGWIAEPAGNSMLVTFYAAGEEAAPKAVYRATVLGGRVTSREIFLGAERPALTPVQARMAAARAASDSDELRACTDQPFNVFVAPPAAAGAAVDVYRVSAIAQRGRVPVGGHYRSTVAADGSVETHAFANACPMVDVPTAAEGEQARPIGITHLADPLPTEMHMLLAQTVGRPLLVVAGDPQRVWLVSGERIAEIRN